MAACIAIPEADAIAADKLTLQLKWLPQAQFAGYYMAQSKGYYKRKTWRSTSSPAARISFRRA
jgi:NitT/TauT family transport system substrate-binding protein